MSRLVCGIRRISISTCGRGIILICVVYRVVVSKSRDVRYCVTWWRCSCDLGWSCNIANISHILSWERTSSRRMPIVFGANHGVIDSLVSFGCVFQSSS